MVKFSSTSGCNVTLYLSGSSALSSIKGWMFLNSTSVYTLHLFSSSGLESNFPSHPICLLLLLKQLVQMTLFQFHLLLCILGSPNLRSKDALHPFLVSSLSQVHNLYYISPLTAISPLLCPSLFLSVSFPSSLFLSMPLTHSLFQNLEAQNIKTTSTVDTWEHWDSTWKYCFFKQ